MKFFLASLLLLLAPLSSLAQTALRPEQRVRKSCRASEITGGPEWEKLRRVQQRLESAVDHNRARHIYIALIDSREINAWDHNFGMTESLICIPISLVHFIGESEGELAFFMAHEMGHALDDTCKTANGRAQVASRSNPLSLLLRRPRLNEQRSCEARADTIAFKLFTASGYNPYDAAAAFGRLEMYLGDTSTGVIARLGALGGDHPMTPDRIKHMRELLIAQAALNSH
jgi:predicted Zn-dependent protease